jgi:Flp pilus assembly pilin Flp
MLSALNRLWTDENGLAALEYAILVALVAVAGLAAWRHLGELLGNMAQDATAEMSAVQ